MDILTKLFENATNFPKKTAIICQDVQYTYQQFDSITTQLSYDIGKIVGSGKNIIIDGDNSIETLCSIYAVLKSGNTYIPISTKYTETKRKTIITDSNPSLYISAGNLKAKSITSILPTIEVTFNLLSDYSKRKYETIPFILGKYPYILYTSGSTGKPKGVRCTAKNLYYILNNLNLICPGSCESKYIFSTPFVFDVSITEIFGFVMNCSALILVDKYTDVSIKRLVQVITEAEITHFSVSPAFLNTILTSFSEEYLISFAKRLEYVLVAGEKFNVNILRKWPILKNEKCKLFNFYGPTEASVYALFYEVDFKLDNDLQQVPIGKPLAGADYLVKNPDKRGIGELVIYGDGVSAGYFNESEDINKAFGKKNGRFFYCTGDLVYINDLGNVEFVGRKDNQIQVNGIRVELGEIETTIEECSGVDSAIVLEIEEKIVSFIQSKTPKKKIKEILKSFLNDTVPKYLHPNSIVVFERFPLTTSQKIDRNILKNKYLMEQSRRIKSEQLSSTEKSVVRIFSEVFNINEDNLDSSSNFFELGGDSLSATLTAVMLEEKFNLSIEGTVLYQNPSINLLSKWIEQKSQSKLIVNSKIEDLLISKQSLKEKLSEFLTNIDNSIDYMFPAGPVPSYYYDTNFKSVVMFDLSIEKEFNIDYLTARIYGLLEEEELLTSSLESIGGEVYFQRHKLLKNGIPIFKVSGKKLEFFIDKINRLNSELVLQSRYNGTLLYSLCIVECEDRYYILGGFDHCIFDQASISIFQKKLLHKLYNKSLTQQFEKKLYSTYIKKILSEINREEEYKNNEYIKSLKKFKKNEVNSVLEKLPRGSGYYSSEIIFNLDVVMNSLYSAFIVASELCKNFEMPLVSILLFLDGRKIYGRKLEEMLGDLHSEIPLIYERGQSFEEFVGTSKKILELEILNNGIMPMEFAFNSIKSLSKVQKDIQYLLDDNICIMSNFMGVFTRNDYQSFKEGIFELQNNLEKNSTFSRVYVTSVICDGLLHIHLNRQLKLES